VVPLRQGVLSLSTTCPALLICTRSLASAGAHHGTVVIDRNVPLNPDGTPACRAVWGQMCME